MSDCVVHTWDLVVCQYYVCTHLPTEKKAEEPRTVVWQSLDWSHYLSGAGLHSFGQSIEYELCLRATWNPSQHDPHNGLNFPKPQSKDLPPTPTVAHLSDWTGWPMTAKHIQSLGPSSCLSSWEKSKPFEWAQQPAATAFSPACFYTMIFKSQIKQKKKTVGALILVSPSPFTPFPSHKPLLELVHRIIKSSFEAKINYPPIMHFCTISEQREKQTRKITKSVLFSQTSRGPRPPEGKVKFVINAGRRGETNREKKKGDRRGTK